jgi:hypothetical protein
MYFLFLFETDPPHAPGEEAKISLPRMVGCPNSGVMVILLKPNVLETEGSISGYQKTGVAQEKKHFGNSLHNRP